MASEASAAMALVTAAVEKHVHIVGFSTGLIPLAISARQRLDDVLRTMQGHTYGATDCAQPMLYAFDKGLKIDTFVVYTDSETYFGQIHPVEALRRYRAKSGIPAKLIVVGMTSNGFSIADPNDAGMMDIVGFDSATPGVMSDFIRGSSQSYEEKAAE